MIRYAMIKGARSRREVEAYLPDNYSVIHEFTSADSSVYPLVFVIKGKDNAGWGLNSYVAPRLASGSIACIEIDLSHPVMKEIPA